MRRKEEKHELKAWVLSVDMGYGHQRAAYPLKDIAFERIITVNSDKIISDSDRKWWEGWRNFYESISRMKQLPIIGSFLFKTYDYFQSIASLYPIRDLSKPNYSVIKLKKRITAGLCSSVIKYTSSRDDLPVITTHFIPALAYHYNGKEIYCVVTDTDINRIWVPDKPKHCHITYFAPCMHVVHRLKEYGVPEERIVHTGFPLPKENIGDHQEILKKDIAQRLINLDPNKMFFGKYHELVRSKLDLGRNFDIRKIEKIKTHQLTLTFTIGGAGAQKDIGKALLKSLKKKIIDHGLKLNIAVGTKLDLKAFFEQEIHNLGLSEELGQYVCVIFALDKKSYFTSFNQCLRATDILWTKPSEMAFYAALGIPIIIAPPIGAHEHYNMEWLQHIGSGFVQENPEYANDWLYYWLSDGRLADAALQGFIDAPVMGIYNIEEYLKEYHKTYKLSSRV